MTDQYNGLDYIFYTSFYPELTDLTNEQALLHWQTIGQSEGRYGNQDKFFQQHDLNIKELPLDFNVAQYLKFNPDINVENAYFAILHYLKYGRYENRNFTDDLSKIIYDGFIGRNILGWALCHNQGKQKINLKIGNSIIGSIFSDVSRTDVADHLNLLFNKVGYNHDMGAVLQFIAITNNSLKLSLELDNLIETNLHIELPIENSITFSPMSLVVENRHDYFSYYANRIRLVTNKTLEITLCKMKNTSLKNNFLVTLYQLNDNQLTGIGFKYCSEDEHVKISASILNYEDPILFVVTDKNTNSLIYSDCIPYPILFHSDYELMMELHGLYVGRQSPLKVIRKLERNWLEFKVKTLYPEFAISSGNSSQARSNTAVIFYSRDKYAITNIQFLPNWQHFGVSAYLIDPKSSNVNLIAVSDYKNDTDDQNYKINSFKEIPCQYFLFYDVNSCLRADYLAIIGLYCNTNKYKAISGNNITYDGISSPNYTSHKPLTNGIKGNLLESHCVLFDKKTVEIYAVRVSSSSKFIPENIISSLNESDLFHLRIPVSLSKRPFLIGKQEKNLANLAIKEKISFQNKKSLSFEKSGTGFSVIINFRDFAEVTKKSILSLRLQNYSSNIEVILVNNGSHSSSRREVEFYAISLFGSDAVKVIDYPHTFNHSLQSNLAAKIASYPLLLMLSNDAFLLSPNCLNRVADVLKNKSIATCGFRILRNVNENYIVESVGLRLALGQLCSLGGQLLKRNIPLDVDSDKTLRVAGNTFAAIAVRKEVYDQLDGLNEVDFPTNYNDVDFCLRASRMHLLHVALGDCMVEHAGRGSREPDLDFPVNPAILKSLENVNELSDGYSTYNFGNTLIF